MITTRLAKPADATAIKALSMQAAQRSAFQVVDIAKLVALDPSKFFTGDYHLVAEDAGKVCGFASFTPPPTANTDVVHGLAFAFDHTLTSVIQKAVVLALLRAAFDVYYPAAFKRVEAHMWADGPLRPVLAAIGFTEAVTGKDPLTGAPHVVSISMGLAAIKPLL